MAVGSSGGAQDEASVQQQAQSEEKNCGVTESVEVARRLSLDSVVEEEEYYEITDLIQTTAENKKGTNGTVAKKQDGNIDEYENKGIQGEEDNKEKEPWVNMFKNNRVANNGMQLNCFPPQIVNGETMVQLEGKEVQEEEAKWKCALIAYVVGECPGYNVMNIYIMMNRSKAGKPTLFLHEEGYFMSSFRTWRI